MTYAELVIRTATRIRRVSIPRRSHLRAACRAADYQARQADVLSVWIEAYPTGRRIYKAKVNRVHYEEPKLKSHFEE